MPRWFPSLRRTEPDLTKAADGQTFSAAQMAAVLQAVSAAPQVTGVSRPLPRSDPQVAFGPGLPLIPAAIDPLRPDTQRPEPRFNEYPVSSNLPGVTDRIVPWKVLRDAADAGGIPRRCIEIRKAEVATLDWAITLSKSAITAAQAANPGGARADIESELRKKLDSEIARCSRFWQKPDPGQDENTIEWLSKLLEDHLVLDAVAIYPRRTYGGDLYALEILDAATIKPLRDWRGGRPLPPNPAYQQILWGFPRGEFVADVDDAGEVINGYLPDQLIYKRRNVRSTTLYGYSAVEQSLADVDVWLRRHQWIKAEYTDGTMPTGWIKPPTESSWTPAQVAEYERFLNDTYTGQTSERHRLRILPPGFEPELLDSVAEKYKPEYDLYLLKLVASHFDVTIAELGFTDVGGLGSTGYHEGQADVQERKGTLPTLRWVQGLITSISHQHLNMPDELEFRFLGLEDEDEAAADAVALERVQWGRMTLNEDRDRQGQPRYDFPEADKPMLMTSRGVVFLEGASETAPPGETVGPVQAPPNTDANGNGVPDRLEAPQGREDEDDDGEGSDRPALVKAELASYWRWARRNPTAGRPFEFQVVTKADAPDLDSAPVVFAGGDAAPKGGERPDRWPGWDRDLTTADTWVPRITAAMASALDVEALAEQWVAEQLVKADRPDLALADDRQDAWAVTAALAWLHQHHVTLIPALAFLRLVWLEGYAIGDRSAQAVLAGHDSVDVWEWAEGDTEAATRALTPEARTRFDTWARQAAQWASSIGASRLKVLAGVLASAKGISATGLAQRIRAALADSVWARLTAITEITRASNAAAQAAYQAAGTGQLNWGTEDDDRVCPACSDNEGAGPLPAGSSWPSGNDTPPAHPGCRCWLYPA